MTALAREGWPSKPQAVGAVLVGATAEAKCVRWRTAYAGAPGRRWWGRWRSGAAAEAERARWRTGAALV